MAKRRMDMKVLAITSAQLNPNAQEVRDYAHKMRRKKEDP